MKPPRKAQDDTQAILQLLQNFIVNPKLANINIPLLAKTAPIDFNDPLLELLPEVYIDSTPISKKELELAVDNLARETASLLIRFRKENIAEALDAKD